MKLEEIKIHINEFKENKIDLNKIIEYLQKFIDEDERIINLFYLKNNMTEVHSFIVGNKMGNKIKSRLRFRKTTTSPNTYAYIKTFEDIQKFIFDHNVKDPKDLRKRYSGVDSIKLKILNSEQRNQLVWLGDYNRKEYKFLDSTEKWQEYIDKWGLKTPIELKTISDGLYGKYFKLPKKERDKIKWKIKQPVRVLPKEKRDWSHITKLEQVQDFVYKNSVVNQSDLYKRFRGLANKFSGQLNLINYVGPMNITTGEAYLIRNLIKYNVNFVFQKTYPDCRNIEAYRFDLHLVDFDILLEYHGAAHFGEGIRYSEKRIEADKVKNEYAKSHGIRIYYFTFEKKLYEERGYFDKVYTDIDELFSEMGINTSIINQNYDEEVKEYFSQDINYFNKFIQRNEVISLKDLRDRFPTVYYRINRYKYQGYLNYYKS